MKHLQEFIEYLSAERNYSNHTLSGYKSDIVQFLSSLETNSIENINKQSIRGFISSLARKEMSAPTRNRKLAAIRSFCKFLHIEGYLNENPSVDIQRAKEDQKLPITFTINDTCKIIDSASNTRDKAILESLYGLGVRVFELSNMKIRDINFAEMTVRVFGKGAKQRIIPINGSAFRSIIEYLEGINYEPNSYLFSSPNDKNRPLTTRAIYDVVAKYSKVNNIDGMSPHKFRHSCATHLLSNGLDIRYIQELLGHSNINTTTIYAKVVSENMAKNYHSAHPRG